MESVLVEALGAQLSYRGFELGSFQKDFNHYIICRGTHKETGTLVYVTTWRSTEPEEIAAKCELHSVLNLLPNIVQLLDHFQFEFSGLQHYVSVTEYIEKDLYKEISFRAENDNPWSESLLMETARSLVETLALLRENGLTHLCHLHNIYIMGNLAVKIGNFLRVAAIDSEPCDLQEVTVPDYLSPELHSQQNADVYSLGKTLLCCYRLETRESDSWPEDLSAYVAEVKYERLRELLKEMLRPDHRLDATQLWRQMQATPEGQPEEKKQMEESAGHDLSSEVGGERPIADEPAEDGSENQVPASGFEGQPLVHSPLPRRDTEDEEINGTQIPAISPCSQTIDEDNKPSQSPNLKVRRNRIPRKCEWRKWLCCCCGASSKAKSRATKPRQNGCK